MPDPIDYWTHVHSTYRDWPIFFFPGGSGYTWEHGDWHDMLAECQAQIDEWIMDEPNRRADELAEPNW